MAPLTPSWPQPSHPDIQKVHYATEKDSFTTKSTSTIDLPPHALFAKMSFPPCTFTWRATYATVQIGRDQHMNLNSDLVYINHSCVPSVIFDTSSFSILAGPKGLKVGDELTFFYPSTEWDMAQGFNCFCGADTCRGFISGAKDMEDEQLEGMWLNSHITGRLSERGAQVNGTRRDSSRNKVVTNEKSIQDDDVEDTTAQALRHSLRQAELALQAARKGLDTYLSRKVTSSGNLQTSGFNKGSARENGEVANQVNAETATEGEREKRRGVTNREMSGEMGGDTRA